MGLTTGFQPSRHGSLIGGPNGSPFTTCRAASFVVALATILVLAGCGSAGQPRSSPAATLPAPTPTGGVSPRLTATPTAASLYSYREAPCAFTPPAGEKISCGWLTVPEVRALYTPDATTNTIRLHVAVVKSHSAAPAADPLVILAGGPGERAIDSLMTFLSKMAPVLAKRDLVIFDQRGAGYSMPSLDCPEHDPAECHDRLVREAINLAGYNNDENADDVNDLRRALGYDRVNLYGGSYGTLLGLTVMRRHPDGVRSVVLDSVVPPQISIDIEEARSFERSFDRLFDACAADPACNTAFPSLKDVFLRTVERLDRTPATVHVRDETTGAESDSTQSGASFAYVAWYYMQYTEAIPYLPRLIWATGHGDYQYLSDLLRRMATARDTISEGMNRAISCSCMGAFESDAEMREAVSQIDPALRENVAEGMSAGYRDCALWQVPAVPLEEREPVQSDIPTLLLAGRFDPLSPAEWAEQAAETLGHSYLYVFPDAGHGVVRTSGCAWQMISAFLDDPAAAPDDRCFRETPPPEFALSPGP